MGGLIFRNISVLKAKFNMFANVMSHLHCNKSILLGIDTRSSSFSSVLHSNTANTTKKTHVA